MKALSKKQQELIDAMKKGVKVLWVGGIHASYFRNDNLHTCTSTVFALINKGFLKRVDETRFGDHKIEMVE